MGLTRRDGITISWETAAYIAPSLTNELRTAEAVEHLHGVYWDLVAIRQVGLSAGTLGAAGADRHYSAVNAGRLSTKDVADLHGISERTVRRAVKEGRLDAYLVNGMWRITEAAAARYAPRSRKPPEGDQE